ncbi:MAG: hypothetical protein HYS20_14275 [Rhodocyclales bacterium]|nr:hypothetical protein [Rhodocyclales bacterium]
MNNLLSTLPIDPTPLIPDIVGNLTALTSLAGITHRLRFDAIDQPTGYDTPPVAPTGEFPLDTRPSRKSLQSGYSPLS